MKKIILASTSSYRKKLLEQIGLEVECIAPQCDEQKYHQEGHTPKELALQLSQLKARSVAKKGNNSCVIAGDQVAALEETILGKPITKQRAIEQISLLAGKTHHLFTAITIIDKDQEYSFVDDTALSMRELTPIEIKKYVDQDMPLDCAGSYKIESLGINLFHKIVTEDHTAIIGIPLIKLSSILRERGINPLKN